MEASEYLRGDESEANSDGLMMMPRALLLSVVVTTGGSGGGEKRVDVGVAGGGR